MAWPWGRKAKPAYVPIDLPAPRKRKIVVGHAAAASARLAGGSVDPFIPASSLHPKPSSPSSSGLAMDSAEGYAQWASAAVGGLIAEGQAFLGYPRLAEMAQRAEYRRPVETLARHMTREWIEFKSKSENDQQGQKIGKLTAAVQKLRVRPAVRKWIEQDGFFGRGHIYIDTGHTDKPEELKTSIGNGSNEATLAKIGPGLIKAFRPVEPVWVYPTNYDSINPLKPEWYTPASWFVMGTEVHASRLLRLIGREVPDLLKPAYSFGGLPLTQMGKPYVDNWLETRQSVNDIISAFSQFVLGTDLAEALESNGGQNLFDRAELFNNLRDNRGLMVIDKESEQFQNVAAPLGTLDSLQAQAQEHMAAVFAIPLIELLGIQPAGLNASSEGEIRTFEQWIKGAQEALLREPLETMTNMVQLSEFGEIDPDITFDFVPLRSLDEKGIAEKQNKEAEADCRYVEVGILDAIEVRRTIASDPTTRYPGLDVDDVPIPPVEEPKPEFEDAGV